MLTKLPLPAVIGIFLLTATIAVATTTTTTTTTKTTPTAKVNGVAESTTAGGKAKTTAEIPTNGNGTKSVSRSRSQQDVGTTPLDTQKFGNKISVVSAGVRRGETTTSLLPLQPPLNVTSTTTSNFLTPTTGKRSARRQQARTAAAQLAQPTKSQTTTASATNSSVRSSLTRAFRQSSVNVEHVADVVRNDSNTLQHDSTKKHLPNVPALLPAPVVEVYNENETSAVTHIDKTLRPEPKTSDYIHFDINEEDGSKQPTAAPTRAARMETVNEVLSNLFPNGFTDIFRFSYASEHPTPASVATPDAGDTSKPTSETTTEPKLTTAPSSTITTVTTTTEKTKEVPTKAFYRYETSVSKEYRRELRPGHTEIVVEKLQLLPRGAKIGSDEFSDDSNLITKDDLLRINRAAADAPVLPSMLMNPSQENVNGTAEQHAKKQTPIIILNDDDSADMEGISAEDNLIAESQNVGQRVYQRLPAEDKPYGYKIGVQRQRQQPESEVNFRIVKSESPNFSESISQQPIFVPEEQQPEQPADEGRVELFQPRHGAPSQQLDSFQEHAEQSFHLLSPAQEAPSRHFLRNFNPVLSTDAATSTPKGSFHYESNALQPIIFIQAGEQANKQSTGSGAGAGKVENAAQAQKSTPTALPRLPLLQYDKDAAQIRYQKEQQLVQQQQQILKQQQDLQQQEKQQQQQLQEFYKELQQQQQQPAVQQHYAIYQQHPPPSEYKQAQQQQPQQFQYVKHHDQQQTIESARKLQRQQEEEQLRKQQQQRQEEEQRRKQQQQRQEEEQQRKQQEQWQQQEQQRKQQQRQQRQQEEQQRKQQEQWQQQEQQRKQQQRQQEEQQRKQQEQWQQQEQQRKQQEQQQQEEQRKQQEQWQQQEQQRKQQQQRQQRQQEEQQRKQQQAQHEAQRQNIQQQQQQQQYQQQQQQQYSSQPPAPSPVFKLQSKISADSVAAPASLDHQAYHYPSSPPAPHRAPATPTPHSVVFVTLHAPTLQSQPVKAPTAQPAYTQKSPQEYASAAASGAQTSQHSKSAPPTPAAIVRRPHGGYTFVEVQKSVNIHNKLITEKDGKLVEEHETIYPLPQYAPQQFQQQKQSVVVQSSPQPGTAPPQVHKPAAQAPKPAGTEAPANRAEIPHTHYPLQYAQQLALIEEGVHPNDYYFVPKDYASLSTNPINVQHIDEPEQQEEASSYAHPQQILPLPNHVQSHAQHQGGHGEQHPQHYVQYVQQNYAEPGETHPEPHAAPQQTQHAHNEQQHHQEAQHQAPPQPHAEAHHPAAEKEIVEQVVTQQVEKIVERPVHIPYPVHVQQYIDRPYPVQEIVETHIPVPYPVPEPVAVPVHVERYIDRPYPVEKIVEKRVPYPVEKVVERIVEKEIPIEVEKVVEKLVDRPIPIPIRVPVAVPVPYAHQPLPEYNESADIYGPPYQPHPNALGGWSDHTGIGNDFGGHIRTNLQIPPKVLQNYYTRMLKKLLPKALAQRGAPTSTANTVYTHTQARPKNPTASTASTLKTTKQPKSVSSSSSSNTQHSFTIGDIRIDLKPPPPPPTGPEWSKGARYIYNTLPHDLSVAEAADAEQLTETYNGPFTSHNEPYDEFQRWRNGHTLKRSPQFGRNLQMEYGFKPPLVPSVEINDQGIPLNTEEKKTEQ